MVHQRAGLLKALDDTCLNFAVVKVPVIQFEDFVEGSLVSLDAGEGDQELEVLSWMRNEGGYFGKRGLERMNVPLLTPITKVSPSQIMKFC